MTYPRHAVRPEVPSLPGFPAPADRRRWLDKVAAIKPWRRHGERAPHKPLLLLYALGRLQRLGENRPVSFAEAEEPLRELLDEFGPPRPTSPGYPFHHLTSDGLWVVTTPGGATSPGSNLGALRAGAAGSLERRFAEALLADPSLLAQVARYLLDVNFPPTLHDDIAAQVGLDLDASTDGEVVDLVTRRRRDPAFRAGVLLAYEGRCAMCGWEGVLNGEAVGVEAAHVRWFTIGGPDSLDNGLCLCSLHHKLFDAGAVGISADMTIAVSLRFKAYGVVAQALVHDLLGRPIERPQGGQPGLAAEHIAWHREQVFRGPARQVA